MNHVESLESAEQRFDRVMNDPSSTWEVKYAPALRFFRRAYFDREEQDSAIARWVAKNPLAVP